MLHPIYSLKKIYVEKEIEKLNIYLPKDATPEKRPTKKLAVNIELALWRRSSQMKLEAKPAKIDPLGEGVEEEGEGEEESGGDEFMLRDRML